MKGLRTCVTPEKQFRYGLHKPAYSVANLRENRNISRLGVVKDGAELLNQGNFPDGTLEIDKADWIYEIPNPLPFRGTTFIDQEWADAVALDPGRIGLPDGVPCSFSATLEQRGIAAELMGEMPQPVLLALATCSTDPRDLVCLAELSCHIEKDAAGVPVGLVYKRKKDGRVRPLFHNHALFEAVANNPFLPDSYKAVMVLRPGAQGGSEIVGEWAEDGATHVFEYLRRNSYIAGGHYAANMADDAVRYSIRALSLEDMTGLRHLYYQRTYVRLAKELGLAGPREQRTLIVEDLEELRRKIVCALAGRDVSLSATLWGWNFGFDYASSGYRLHASHQQIHQQYAMIPETVPAHGGDPGSSSGELPAFGCGDMVAEVIRAYRDCYQSDFFEDYIACTRNNRRMDGRVDRESSLIVWQDKHALLFVPKAQTSQWELQLMALDNGQGRAVGNIVEADLATRASLDKGILLAQKALAGLGAKMVTSIEYPKRIGRKGEPGQHLLYAFLPRLPDSPGAFSEAQLRFINGHYPEDFATACRQQLVKFDF
jgi:hypothetical protein